MSRHTVSVTREERRFRFSQVDLYPVTCEKLSKGRSDADVLEAVIAAGVRIVQLRDKESSRDLVYEKALHFRRVTLEHGVLLIINDDVELARQVQADGVHLGQDDWPLEAAREALPDMLIGHSTHSLEEALAAERAGADYINIGPIFTTGTKSGLLHILGPGAIAEIASQVHTPFTVMGGIHAGNLDEVLAAGARKIALVTAITQADDMTAAARSLRERIRQAGPSRF